MRSALDCRVTAAHYYPLQLQFTIGDTRGFGSYTNGGYMHQVKQKKMLTFKSLRQSLADPEFLMSDFAKFDRPLQLHLGFQALHAFRAAHGELPAPSDAAHAAELLSLAKGMPGGGDVEFSERLLRNLASGARGELSPLCAFFGGIAAQEVMKACSGKFTPCLQWMYFDAEEALPGNGVEPLPAAETAPRGSRYDAQACVLGWKTQEQLGRLKYMLVGAGAIGCEMVKNWAMMGLGAGEGGKVVVTDPDTIEKSNLNRQFLFRPWDVTKAKSDTAAAAIQQMNPQMTIEAQLNRVGPETEDIFDDDFWEAPYAPLHLSGPSAPSGPQHPLALSALRHPAPSAPQHPPALTPLHPALTPLIRRSPACATRSTTCRHASTSTSAASTTRSRCSSPARSAPRATCSSSCRR